MALKRKLSVLFGAGAVIVSLAACGTGGETDDGNSGQDTPTAVPTGDDGDAGEDEGSQSGGDGSGED